MKLQRQESQDVDIMNYLAIISLETLGNMEPTQTEISAMEKILTLSLQASINRYQQTQGGHCRRGLSKPH